MKNVDIVPFIAAHAEAILEQGLQVDEGHDWSQQAGIMEDAGYCITLMSDGGDPILATGIIPIWEGAGEAWLLGSTRMPEYPITLARAIYECFYEWIEHRGLWRVQANIRADWLLAVRFAKFIGMKEEGLMRKFGPEQADYYRYAWVRSDD